MVAAALAASPEAVAGSTGAAMAVWVLAGVGLAAWYLLPMWYYLPTVRASDPEVMFATAKEFARWHIGWEQALRLGRLAVDLRTGVPLRVPMRLP